MNGPTRTLVAANGSSEPMPAGFSAQGKGGPLCRAKRDALAGLPRMLRKRTLIQRGRKATVLEILRVLRLGPILRR